MVNNDLEKILKTHLEKNAIIIIGVSGGSDSVYLLEQLVKIKKNYPLEIIIAHLNHGFRGKESDRDAKFVKDLAKKFGLPFEQKKLKPAKTTGNLEEYFRQQRYRFFEKIKQKYHADWVVTAHNLNDKIETALFNLIRGSFLNGIRGMQIANRKTGLLRPLLTTDKEQILSWLKLHKVKFCTDQTNYDLKYSRNFLRHKVIPLFKKINKNFEETFNNNLENINAANNFIDQYCQEWLNKNFSQNGISLKKFLQLSPVLQKTILATIYKNLYGNTNKFNQKHLNQLMKIIHNQKSNRKKEFGDKHFLSIKTIDQIKQLKIEPGA